MSYDWGPHYIVPSEGLKVYAGTVLLREYFDEDLLQKELKSLDVSGPVVRVTNPWYYRKRNTNTWIKIGESDDKEQNFPAKWDTTGLENGQYEVMGLMHVFARNGIDEILTIAGQNIVAITVEN